jgi:hypothetical protein
MEVIFVNIDKIYVAKMGVSSIYRPYFNFYSYCFVKPTRVSLGAAFKDIFTKHLFYTWCDHSRNYLCVKDLVPLSNYFQISKKYISKKQLRSMLNRLREENNNEKLSL